MFLVIICGVFLSITADVVCYDPDYEAVPGGWIKPHKVMSSWFDAVEQCHKEGAILASPTTEDILYKMLSIISANGHNTPYYIGNNANLKYGLYVSLEGVPLNNMPVVDMIDVLDPTIGLCMTMDHKTLRAVSCSSRWPYMCFKPRDDNLNMTECGTFDNEYKRLSATGNCYKFHSAKEVNWVEAYGTCIDEGGYLAIINDSQEALHLKHFIWEHHGSNATYVHIGLLEWKLAGPWFSVHWEPFDKIYNIGFTPSDLTSHVSQCKDHRGVITRSGKVTYSRDSSSDLTKFLFICEKDPAYNRFNSEKTLQINRY